MIMKVEIRLIKGHMEGKTASHGSDPEHPVHSAPGNLL